MSELRSVRVQYAQRQSDGSIKKEDVNILTDAEAVTMDGKGLKKRVGELIDGRISELIDGAPDNLDTLKELANELLKNQSGVSTILNELERCASKSDIPKNLLDLTEDSTHRTVTDDEKKAWNKIVYDLEKLEEKCDSNYDVTRQAIQHNTQSINDVSAGIQEIGQQVHNYLTENYKQCLVLTQAEYDKLSSQDKSREDILYFIKG